MRVAFIGLGVMGHPMAGHLAAAGHDVVVFNRTAEKAQRWVAEHGNEAAPTPADAARRADVAFCCVGNDDDVREVTLGAGGVLESLAPGSLLVDHTTASAEIARELAAAAAERSVGFVDAPLSGGQVGAETGQLTIMAGGSEADYSRAAAVMSAYAKATTLIGPAGCGQLAKMVNQICIAGVLQGLAEGLHFAECAQLDAEKVVGAISKGAAQSWQMDNRWKTMIEREFEFGFAVDWMRKDLGMALAEAGRNGASLEMTRLVDGFYADVQSLGGKRWDTSSLIARLAKPR